MSLSFHLPWSRTESSEPAPSSDSTSFTLSPTTSVPTDVWRKPGPPEVKSFNAPILYKTIPLSTFKRARVTITGNWSRLYDQGGLILVLQDPSISSNKDQRWVKTGIEFYQGEAFVGTVGADRWSDWSLVQVGIQEGKTVTLEMEGNGDTLWIYVVDGEKRVPIREVPWILSAGGKDVKAWVGVYAASPKPDGKELEVRFEGWELDLTE
jgi:regulation of enolase protein 1 (concanavalin A-like superfamily)